MPEVSRAHEGVVEGIPAPESGSRGLVSGEWGVLPALGLKPAIGLIPHRLVAA